MHSSPHDPIARLWQAAHALYERMRDHIGQAHEIAQHRYLHTDVLRYMRAWLRPLEAIVRQTVLVQAMKLAREPQPPPRQSKQQTRALTSKPRPSHKPALRLWPRPAPPPARIRDLGPPLLVRDIFRDRARLARSRHLNMVRFMRPPEPLRIARRVEALERVLARPLIAVRRLARKLRLAPKLALALAVRRWPRSPYMDRDAQRIASFESWNGALALNDTS